MKIDVAPLVGARIEICVGIGNSVSVMVAPLVGARIEMTNKDAAYMFHQRRSPRGSAD